MTNQELMAEMKASGRLHVAHIGNQTRYANDEPGSPQIVVKMKTTTGRETTCFVAPGWDERSFRIVLDDAIHRIKKGENLEQAVRRQQAEWSRIVWPENPECWIVGEIDENEIFRTTLEGF